MIRLGRVSKRQVQRLGLVGLTAAEICQGLAVRPPLEAGPVGRILKKLRGRARLVEVMGRRNLRSLAVAATVG